MVCICLLNADMCIRLDGSNLNADMCIRLDGPNLSPDMCIILDNSFQRGRWGKSEVYVK